MDVEPEIELQTELDPHTHNFKNYLSTLAAGLVSGACHNIVAHPADTIKVRSCVTPK